MTYFTAGLSPVIVPRVPPVGSGMGAVRLLSSDSSQNPVILAPQNIAMYFLSFFNRIRTFGCSLAGGEAAKRKKPTTNATAARDQEKAHALIQSNDCVSLHRTFFYQSHPMSSLLSVERTILDSQYHAER